MKEKFTMLIEYRNVLAKADEAKHKGMGDSIKFHEEEKKDEEKKLIDIPESAFKFATMSGVIDEDDVEAFKKIIFRVTRGN